jgi:hypothetical protein
MSLSTNGLTAADLAEIKKMETDTLKELYGIGFDPVQKLLIEEIFKMKGIILEPEKDAA